MLWSVMEMKQYLAHIRRDASAEQTVRAHLLRVGDLMLRGSVYQRLHG